jgi:uncharacterized GH25 family protein
MRGLLLGLSIAATGAVGGAAQAHSPYLFPNAFDASNRDHVTVQGSFTEHPFTPDVVMKSDDFHAVGPDGAKVALTPTYFKDLTVLEAATEKDGTYRITSGVRAGRTSKVIQKDGEWVFLEPGKPVPAGAAPADMQSITVAETYVSRGAPNKAALAPSGKGVEFHALTHPNDIFVGEEAKFEVLLDGKPLSGQQIQIARTGDDMDGELTKVVADSAGKFSIKVDKPGAYLAITRHRVAPKDGQPGRSLTYSLTFEATGE